MKISIKHSYLVKLVFLLGLFFTMQAASAQSKMKNFSGTWVLNVDKSDFGRGTVASAAKVMTLTIQQQAQSMSIKSGDSTERHEDLVKLDGTPSVEITNQVISGIPNTIKGALSVKFINNASFGAALLTDHWLRIRTYTISADLQTLTMDIDLKTTSSDTMAKLVYDKKKSN